MNSIETITLSEENITDFAQARNKLLAKARKDWVLFLDTDERLSGHKFSISNDYSGYLIRRENYFLGSYVLSQYLVRLAKANTGKWKRMVHETWEVKGRVGYIDEPYIIHNTADNLRDYLNKIDFYSTLHAKANRIEHKKSSVLKIVFFPLGKFILTFLKSRNIVFSIMQAFHSFLSWSK